MGMDEVARVGVGNWPEEEALRAAGTGIEGGGRELARVPPDGDGVGSLAAGGIGGAARVVAAKVREGIMGSAAGRRGGAMDLAVPAC